MNMVKRLTKNNHGRDFIIGDLHGCFKQFQEALRAVNFDKSKDRCFSVGDLIDRGPDSEDCLSLLLEPWFYAAKGNHEEILEIIVNGNGDWNWWDANGGGWSRDIASSLLKYYAELAAGLPLVIVVGSGADRFNILHAEYYGSDAGIDSECFSDGDKLALLWGREIIQGNIKPDDNLSLTYVGHTPMPESRRIGPFYYIDTGAFLKELKLRDYGKLTLIEHGVN